MTQSLSRNSGPNLRHRLERQALASTQLRRPTAEGSHPAGALDYPGNVEIEMGWGRLIFAHTFQDPIELANALKDERKGDRDIAAYISDPHVVLSHAPQELFLDPSHTYRLWMSHYRPSRERPQGFSIRRLDSSSDAQAINDIYATRNMVQVDPTFFLSHLTAKHITYLVAEDSETGQIIGTVTGIDHCNAFGDPENGASLWCLAIHPQSTLPGIGDALVRQLAEHYAARGRAYMDLSVIHDNDRAIQLYEKLGFQRIAAFTLKNKNSINEKLFAGPAVQEELNPYALIIVNEARRRGIMVDVTDAEGGFFKLSHGGRTIQCRESLSQLTDAVAMSRCDDKAVTRRVLQADGLLVPDQMVALDKVANEAFLTKHKALVVKPARGEQGRGISVDIRDPESLRQAISRARAHCDVVLLEQFCAGEDLRIIVTDYRVVAAAVRKPPKVIGDGEHSVRALIEKHSRRRASATGGESRIPMDEETERCVRAAGWDLDQVLPDGNSVTVRKTANLHTGGTIHDVTDRLHPQLVEAAVRAAKAIQIPLVGLDFLVERVDGPDYVIIEANERPGLANHEPQPTAERFIDMLFPHTANPIT